MSRWHLSIRGFGMTEAVADAVQLRRMQLTTTRLARRANWPRRLWKLRLGVLGVLIVTGMVAVALLAPAIAPYDPLKQDLGARLIPPVWDPAGSWAHAL